jgi:hypothetical protein
MQVVRMNTRKPENLIAIAGLYQLQMNTIRPLHVSANIESKPLVPFWQAASRRCADCLIGL